MRDVWRSLRLNAWDYVLDGGVSIALTAVAGRDVCTYFRARGPSEDGFFSFLTFQIIFGSAAIWLQIRMGGAVVELSRRSRREELALTLLPARRYLLSRILPRIFRVLLAPALTGGVIFCVLLLYILTDRADELATLTLTGFFMGIGAMSLSVGGVFDQLIRACRRGAAAEGPSLHSPLIWSLLSVGATYGVFAGAIAAAFIGRRILSPDDAFGIALALSIVIAPLSVAFAWRRARQACDAYYTF